VRKEALSSCIVIMIVFVVVFDCWFVLDDIVYARLFEKVVRVHSLHLHILVVA
jgi:hypothetical protein